MELIDSHCHIRDFQSNGTLPDMLGRAAEAGVQRMITVGTSLQDWVPYRELSAAHPGKVFYTVGLHPCYVDAEWADAVRQLSTFFTPPHAAVALGEIGLDYFHLPKDPVAAGELILQQEAACREQLLLASELDVPVIIHSRDCFEETVALIDASPVAWERIVFHCFSYGPDEVRALNDRGGRASFTGIATYKNARAVREALRTQGIERLMLETDCPYLTPEPHRGKPNEPAFLRDINSRCAEALGIQPSDLAARATFNTVEFFGLE